MGYGSIYQPDRKANSNMLRKKFRESHGMNNKRKMTNFDKEALLRKKLKNYNMPLSEYSAKQKKLARVAVPYDKITAADLEVLRGGKKKRK